MSNSLIAAADLDHRLIGGADRFELANIIAEHDVAAGTCQWCGWSGKVCPSRALARAVRDRRSVPAWLAHLVDVVPGAIAPAARLSVAERRAVEDAVPGLFDVLPRRTGRVAFDGSSGGGS